MKSKKFILEILGGVGIWNMDIIFKTLQFKVVDGRVFLNFFSGMRSGANTDMCMPLSEIQLVGGNGQAVYSTSFVGGSESANLRYVSHEIGNNLLLIVERSERLEIETRFISYNNTNAIAVEKSVKNISDSVQSIEKVSTLVLNGVGGGMDNADKTFFYKFVQSHHSECQPRKISLFDYGFFRSYARNFKKLCCANVGSWSTKEELPQGIIENGVTGEFLMFQIESNHNWYYEISAINDDFYLALSGNSSPAHRYVKTLRKQMQILQICYFS